MEAAARALRSLKTSEHMLTITYPLVRDSRLFVAVSENLFLAYAAALSVLLKREDTFDSKIARFMGEHCRKMNAGIHLRIMQELKGIVALHRSSPIEFVRKDGFVICSKNYELKTLTLEKMKYFLINAKVFLNAVIREAR